MFTSPSAPLPPSLGVPLGVPDEDPLPRALQGAAGLDVRAVHFHEFPSGHGLQMDLGQGEVLMAKTISLTMVKVHE